MPAGPQCLPSVLTGGGTNLRPNPLALALAIVVVLLLVAGLGILIRLGLRRLRRTSR